MASHFISFDRGANVLRSDTFTVGTSTSASKVFEFRILDGASVKHLDVINALEALEHYFENAGLVAAGGFDVTT